MPLILLLNHKGLPGFPNHLTITFRVTGSTVFSQADFDRVTAPFVGQPITPVELFQARSAVTQLYLDNGYLTSGAYIPPQEFAGGVVEIQVLEGKLEGIRVLGTRRLKPSYIQSRLALATQAPLNRDKLLQALQVVQQNPLLQSISAELSAGVQAGQSLLTLRVVEAKTFSAQVLLDNGRSPSVGTDRRQLSLTEANLLGFGDSLLKGDLQLANRALLPFEQFALGGLESVRGYRQDALLSGQWRVCLH